MHQEMGEWETQNKAVETETTLQLHFNNISLCRCRFAIRYIYTCYALPLKTDLQTQNSCKLIFVGKMIGDKGAP